MLQNVLKQKYKLGNKNWGLTTPRNIFLFTCKLATQKEAHNCNLYCFDAQTSKQPTKDMENCNKQQSQIACTNVQEMHARMTSKASGPEQPLPPVTLLPTYTCPKPPFPSFRSNLYKGELPNCICK